MRNPLIGQPIAEYLGGRDNHFNLIRLVAALAVLVSHSFAIVTGNVEIEPLRESTGASLGFYSVGIFFGISGLLIARSFDRRKSIWHFSVSRVLRLWPALVLVLLLSMLVLGPIMTSRTVEEYFADPLAWIYVPSNLSLAFRSDALPGVFIDNPLGFAINGSLWTLFYEVVCYGGVVATGLIGLLSMPRLFAVFLALVFAGHFASVLYEPSGGLLHRLDLLGQLGLPFAIGMAAYGGRDHFRHGPAVALILWIMAAVLVQTPFLPPAIMVALVYTVLWLALVPKGPLLKFNRVGDYSYGIYIYAFPI
ncbi:MAG: acyltransferase, partial [Alteraurantiacibacter sp.]